MRIVPLPAEWRARALVISNVGDPEAWFSAEERAVIESFDRPKRREEWMLSRIAERELRRRGASGRNVSYSHSRGYGAAAVDDAAVGIDVEVLRDLPEAAARHFLKTPEEAMMQRCSLPHRLLHFWCAKEAAWKQHGGAVATLKRVPLRLIDEVKSGLRFDSVETYAVDDIVVALTLPTS